MPRYYARAAEARLFVTDLDDSVLKQYSYKDAELDSGPLQPEDSSLESSDDTILREIAVEIEEGGTVHFLRDDDRTVAPFNLVIVGPSVQDLSKQSSR